MNDFAQKRTIWLRTLAVMSGYDESEDVFREIVIARDEIEMPVNGTACLAAQRVNPKRRRNPDRVELAFIDADGRILAKHAGELNDDDIVTQSLKSTFPTATKVFVAIKIMRSSGANESLFFDKETEEPRVKTWVDVMTPTQDAVARRAQAAVAGTTALTPGTAAMLKSLGPADKTAAMSKSRTKGLSKDVTAIRPTT